MPVRQYCCTALVTAVFMAFLSTKALNLCKGPLDTNGKFSLSAGTRLARLFDRTRAISAMALNHRYPTEDVVDPPQAHEATVIFLHGLGDSSQGWLPVGQMLSPALPHVKWVFPTAPTRPISCNGGMRMPGWYDIIHLDDIDQEQDREGLHDAASYLDSLVAKEVATGVPEERVIVGGFSQGGAVALMMLRRARRLGAVLALSTYMPLHKEPVTVSPEAKAATKVFQAHGEMDPLIPFQLGMMTNKHLVESGLDVTFRKYPMAHSACEPELQDMGTFVKGLLATPTPAQ